MSVPHDPNNGLLHVCLLTIENIPLTLDNIKTKLLNMKKHLSYDDIVLVEFNASYYPQCLYDVAHIDKRVQSKERFDVLIKTLKKQNVLKWNKHYFVNYDYYDGGDWSLTITFKNGDTFNSHGDISRPRNYSKVYKELQKYIICSEYENINEIVINKWFKHKL